MPSTKHPYRRPLASRPWDLVFLSYFALHIPISLLMDFQALVDYSAFARPLADLAAWYTATFGDVLMRDARADPRWTWFRAFVWCELVVQMPVFVYAVRKIWEDRISDFARIVLVVYGAHVSTTLVPILATTCSAEAMPGASAAQRAAMIAVYSPFLVVPMMLVWRYGFKYRDMIAGCAGEVEVEAQGYRKEEDGDKLKEE